jgi:outer membrane protein OmpA-like peptidoglycan-associated protein
MVTCTNLFRCSGAGAIIAVLGSATLLLGLAGCNPIETYRNWTGVSANDPNPATTPNAKNLAAGEARGYPNLATVPPPPNQAPTTAELGKLTQSLIADRANVRYISEHLQTEFDEAAAPPPPPQPPAPTGNAARAGGRGSATLGLAAPSVGPRAGTPSAVAEHAAKGPNKSSQPPEPGPMESRLQSPQIALLPQPGQSQPAPPPPRELSIPAASNNANSTASGAHLPAPPAPMPMSAAIGSAKFQPAPPPPSLPPVELTHTAMATGPGKPVLPPIAFEKVMDVTFSGDDTTLSKAARQALDKVLPRYRTKPGLVRVVGYAGIGASATQQLNGYRTALDRAKAVANGLAKAGIPTNKIEVEAAPTGSDVGPGRAEILFEQ